MPVNVETIDFDFVSVVQSTSCRTEASGHIRVEKKKENILPNILSYVGDTPLVRLNRIPQEYGLDCEFLVKCEFFNPGGSVKDRIALRMIEEAEREGKIKPGWTLIEPTSGNSGIGLALAAAVLGYRCIIVMPQNGSAEKINVMRALGAQVIRTPTVCGHRSPNSHFAIAQRLAERIPNSYVLDQFNNSANPQTHFESTAEEILSACNGKLDMIVMGAGTGGTITGIGRKFHEKVPKCTIVCVDPIGTVYLSQKLSIQELEGILPASGSDFVPGTFDRLLVDKWVKVDDNQSFLMARQLIMKEGLLCGGSSGSAVFAAIQVAKEMGLKKGHRIVVILPDGVRNYMTKFLCDDWMTQRGYTLPISNFQGEPDVVSDIPIHFVIREMHLISLHEDISVSDAAALMRQIGCDQLPVVRKADPKYVLGVVSISEIMAKIGSKVIDGQTPVCHICSPQFERLPQYATIRDVTKILNRAHVVVIVENLEPEGRNRIVGIVTQIDIVNFFLEPPETTKM